AQDIRRIPTGIFVVDYATGGGVPVGRMTMVYGQKSSGKSSLLAKLAANAQRLCRHCHGPVVTETKEVTVEQVRRQPDGTVANVKVQIPKEIPVDCVNECRVAPESDEEGKKKRAVWPGRMNVVWIDAEGTFDYKFYTAFGVDCEAVYVVTTDYGEQAIDIADAVMQTRECDLLIVDTVAHLVPKVERETSAEEMQVGVQARMVNKALRKWVGTQNELTNQGETACTIILVNQLRQKIGIFPVFVKPGGVGQDFATSVDIQLWQKELKFDTQGRPLWQDTRFAVEKNKTGIPKMEGRYRICLKEHPGRLPGDTWDDEVTFDAATSNGFIEEVTDEKDKGTGRLLVMGREFDDESALRSEISEKGEFYRTLRGCVLDLMIGRPSDGRLANNKKKRGEVKI
ncbi:MAG TPA: hypothetical protein VMZ50_06200, partial [Phycisphaerae bacterium]|nr:hypothetical protein [Phycisphaerae bacterium]